MDYERDTFLFFIKKINKIFFIKMWYILWFYFSTVQKTFLNASYLYLLKFNEREVILHLIISLKNEQNENFQSCLENQKSKNWEMFSSGSSYNGIYLNKKRFIKSLPSCKYVNLLHRSYLKDALSVTLYPYYWPHTLQYMYAVYVVK